MIKFLREDSIFHTVTLCVVSALTKIVSHHGRRGGLELTRLP